MVRNRIKVKRAEAKLSATALSGMLTDVQSKVAMSFIEQGRVLPTRDSLKQMCEALECLPADLYKERDLDLLSVSDENEAELESVERPFIPSTGHEGQERVRVWMKTEEKDALLRAIDGLGYQNITEWLREMYRTTMQRYAELHLDQHKTVRHFTTPFNQQSQQPST